MDPLPWLVRILLRFDLRRTFRRVCWTGPWPPRLPDGPVIAYANHHYFYDGHLAWLLFSEVLNRPTTVWMDDWDRFPFFSAVGAQPFPPEDPSRRAVTLRRTVRRFTTDPGTVLVYFPEGDLHPPDDGISPINGSTLQRLAQLYPDAAWWPLALHITWHGDSTPTAVLRGGPAHEADGHERTRLVRQWRALKNSTPGPARTLLEGWPGIAETWNFSFATRLFERYL